MTSPGLKFRQNLAATATTEQPLMLLGVINARIAQIAQQLGFSALYLSGSGIATAGFGLPDLGLTSARDVITEAKRITSAVSLPLIVDGDTGFGCELNVAYLVQELIYANVAGVHLEDQAWPKQCGHLDGKKLIPTAEMLIKLKAAIATKQKLDPNFVIIARTDAIAVEGIDAALVRAEQYAKLGVDAIFAEAALSLEQYRLFKAAIGKHTVLLANITEFGKTPLFKRQELKAAGVDVVLYPLSLFRIMNKSATAAMQQLQIEDSQQNMLKLMQTREELYTILNYNSYKQHRID